MRAALYLRISLDVTGEALGVSRQRQDCVELAARRGWDVVQVFTENDTSAAGKAQRPEFEAMLRGVEAGQFDVVVSWSLDRLTRNRPDTVRLIELGQEKRITIALARGSDLDMSTPMGRMMADQLAGWARYEIEQKSDRHKRANVQRAVSGLPHKGRRAYGYELDGMTIRDDEALVLTEIGHKFISGWSVTEIARWLNESGYKTAMGNKFVGVAIRQMLMRKRYAAIREHDGAEYPAAWPAIFDADMWLQIQHRLRERAATLDGKPKPRRALLTGLVFCGACGASMNGTTTYDRKTKQPRKSYRCNRSRLTPDGKPGCGKTTRGAVPLDDFIRQVVTYRLDTPELAELLSADQEDEIGPLLSERDGLRTRLDSLTDDYADGTLDKTSYKRASERVRGRLEAVERQIEQLHRQRFSVALSAGESVADAWARESDGWRRELIGMLIERIDVQMTRKLPRMQIDGKTYYFSPDAIDVKWRV